MDSHIKYNYRMNILFLGYLYITLAWDQPGQKIFFSSAIDSFEKCKQGKNTNNGTQWCEKSVSKEDLTCKTFDACPEKPELWSAWSGPIDSFYVPGSLESLGYNSFGRMSGSLDTGERESMKVSTDREEETSMSIRETEQQHILYIIDHMFKRGLSPAAAVEVIESLDPIIPRASMERRYNFFKNQTGYNTEIPKIYTMELSRLKDSKYLDWTGAGLYQASQLRDIYRDFSENAYANSHSRSPAAHRTEYQIAEARSRILRFTNASPDEYTCIFTAGATGGLKLIGESFPWTSNSQYWYTRINHTSVLGIREYVMAAGGTFRAISFDEVESILVEREKNKKTNGGHNLCLFAFPGKDNFVGHYYPMEWIQKIHQYGLTDSCRFEILIDAAAMAASKEINLNKYSADYIAISFYKLMGYPTGLGAIIAKHRNTLLLQKHYFGGGAIVAASCESEWCQIKNDVPGRFEDGTVSFLAITALQYGLNRLENIGMKKIAQHIESLTDFLVRSLTELLHSNGSNAVKIYGTERQLAGGIVTLNILRPDGGFYPFSTVETDAARAGIHLRGGCFCNPGGCQDYMGLSDTEMRNVNVERRSCSDERGLVHSKPMGAIRISLGYLSRFEDADAFTNFVQTTYLE